MRNFSIVIITLNEEKNIVKILEDLKNQSYKHFEVLVIDSNSDDNTKQEAEAYSSFFKNFCFHNMGKRGISLGRNTGGQMSNYEDIVFVDADTRLDSHFLEELSLYLDEHPEVGAGAFKLSLRRVKAKHKVGNALINASTIVLQHVFPVCNGACMYSKKSVFEAVGGFDEEITLGEDSAFSVSTHKKGYKFRIIPVRFHSNPRRYEKDGTLNTLTTYLLSGYYLFIKKDKHKKLDYDFGNYEKK